MYERGIRHDQETSIEIPGGLTYASKDRLVVRTHGKTPERQPRPDAGAYATPYASTRTKSNACIFAEAIPARVCQGTLSSRDSRARRVQFPLEGEKPWPPSSTPVGLLLLYPGAVNVILTE